ncbi:hypothetical protein REPUB_Repub03eG0048700 [Reevesia pubescens]
MPPPTLQSFLDAAEENFKSQNLEEAIKQANMARDYVDQFLIAYSLHVISQIKTNGVQDWYAILGILDCKADAETIKKAYKRLALKLHPDKNNSAAAADAFKLVSEAWRVLSEPSSRQIYDQKRGSGRPPKRPWHEKDEQEKEAASNSSKRPTSSEQMPPNNGARAGGTQSNTIVPNSQAPSYGASNNQAPPNSSGPGNWGGGTNSQYQAPPYGASYNQAPPNFTSGPDNNGGGGTNSHNQAPLYGASYNQVVQDLEEEKDRIVHRLHIIKLHHIIVRRGQQIAVARGLQITRLLQIILLQEQQHQDAMQMLQIEISKILLDQQVRVVQLQIIKLHPGIILQEQQEQGGIVKFHPFLQQQDQQWVVMAEVLGFGRGQVAQAYALPATVRV